MNDSISKIAKLVVDKYMLSIPIDFGFLKKIGLSLTFADTPEAVDGLLVHKEIIINNNSPHVRSRFTIAHEIGHYFIPWHYGIFSCDEKDDYNEYEKEANHFAGELLMPESEVEEIWIKERYGFISTINFLVKRANVSLEAAIHRLSNFAKKRGTAFMCRISDEADHAYISNFVFPFSYDTKNSLLLITTYKNAKHETSMVGSKVISIWTFDISIATQYLDRIDCQFLSARKTFKYLQDLNIPLFYAIPILYNRLEEKYIFTISYKGKVIRCYKNVKNGLVFSKYTDEFFDSVLLLKERCNDGYIQYSIYDEREKNKYEGRNRNGDSRELLKLILLDIGLESKLQSINGIIAACNSMNKDKGRLNSSEDYYSMLNNAFKGRDALESFIAHPLFNQFIWCKSVELNAKWNC